MTFRAPMQMDPNCGVYKIVNRSNGKFYIGSTRRMKSRRRDHFYHLAKNKHRNSYLQNAYNAEPDKTVFEFEMVILCAVDQLLEYEQFCIDQMKPAYNISKIAGTIEQTEEVKRKRVESVRAFNQTDEGILCRREKGKSVSAANITRGALLGDSNPVRKMSKEQVQIRNLKGAETKRAQGTHPYGDRNPVRRMTDEQRVAFGRKGAETRRLRGTQKRKLSDEQVIAILQSKLSVKQQAKMYGVHETAIWAIVYGRSHSNILPDFPRKVFKSPLNEEKAIEILKSNLSAKELAKKFSVTEGSIYNIWKGATWKHLGGKRNAF